MTACMRVGVFRAVYVHIFRAVRVLNAFAYVSTFSAPRQKQQTLQPETYQSKTKPFPDIFLHSLLGILVTKAAKNHRRFLTNML